MYDYEPYKLPAIDFVGGEQQDYKFYIYDRNQEAFDLTGYTAEFAVQSYTNKNGTTLIRKSMTIATSYGMPVLLTVSLTKSDTVNLYGKYIYQITIKDSEGKPLIPSQGTMYITNNIDRAFLNS